MKTVAILGAGELGATLARRLAESGRFARICLVDADEGRAKGKALDLLQSGPVEGYDTHLEGARSLKGLGAVDALVVAEAADLPVSSPGLAPPDSFVREVVETTGAGVLVVATAHGAALVAQAVRVGLPRIRVVGSSPLATAAALRSQLANQLSVAPSAVTLTVLGLPPGEPIVPQGSATVGGLPVLTVSPLALRRVLEAVKGRVPGPVSLAAAASRVLVALFTGTPTVLPVFATLDGEYGHRQVALSVPARLGHGRTLGIVETSLETVDRTAFDTLAARALAAGA
jgi:malate dehydrogenase